MTKESKYLKLDIFTILVPKAKYRFTGNRKKLPSKVQKILLVGLNLKMLQDTIKKLYKQH